jgi:hypothetical protein
MKIDSSNRMILYSNSHNHREADISYILQRSDKCNIYTHASVYLICEGINNLILRVFYAEMLKNIYKHSQCQHLRWIRHP